ncbi:MAG TPA: selenocysteine-specific translation elongation factor [Candidatus Limnocylindrales bacterium]
MTVVIGTAGHIDHGKTSLLRALTGIDADRLPEERQRGLTIDVGYAHLDLDDGTAIDFVDVPGHDRYVGNMLVGAGEIDAALLVVAADDGPRPQTIEHLQLLDALGIRDGIAIVTKIDTVDVERAATVREEVMALLAETTLGGSPVLLASSTSREGMEAVRAELLRLRDRALVRAASRPAGPVRLAIDRAFAVKGRGAVVTGSLRGGSLADGERLRLQPGGDEVRVRGLQVHNRAVSVHDGGRLAANLAGAEVASLRRGQVLTRGPGIEVTDRLLALISPAVALAAAVRPTWPPRDGSVLRLHVGTEQVDATVRRRGRAAAAVSGGGFVVELGIAEPVATFVGDRGVLRQPSPGVPIAGAVVLDPRPPRGPARRRVDPERLSDLAVAVEGAGPDAVTDALLRLHGALPMRRVRAVKGALRPAGRPELSEQPEARELVLAPDVTSTIEARIVAAVAAGSAVGAGAALVADVRASALRALRHLVAIDRDSTPAAVAAVDRVLDSLVVRNAVARDGDRVRDPAGPIIDPDLEAAMTRLEAALAVPAPPDLAAAARAAACPPEGIRRLIASGRITRLDKDLAWSTPTYHRLARLALDMAEAGPLAPAALRDATGTSRRFVLAILEDLDRREILRRTPDGHVPGPRAPKPQAGEATAR